jgi:RNA polymerase sigma-70 factor (ECF subfamily)
MLAVARRFMGDEDEARDALQDAFVQVLRSIAGFSGRAQLGTWLHRVVVNACLMRLRKRRHTRHVSLACMGGELPAVPSSAASDPSERLLHEQRWRMVTRCLSRLPEGYRSVLVMRYLEERDTHETATLIGISRNAVKIRLHRARLACRAMLRECSGAGAWR